MRGQVQPQAVTGFLLPAYIMNIAPGFIKSPSFLKFERLTGDTAYKYTVLLGMYCQQIRCTELEIKEPIDLELIIGATENGDQILANLIKCELIEEVGKNKYFIKYFVDTNAQLLSLWKNGEMKAKKAKAKAGEEVDNTIPYEWPSLLEGTKWDRSNEG
jgi:hypothetical protein